MADHVRTQLRGAVASAVTGLTTTGARVFASRAYPVRPAELPCLLVYVANEDAEQATLDDDVERRIVIRIEGLAKADADLEDELDQIAKEVEIALSVPLTLGAWQTELSYAGAELDLNDTLELQAGSVLINFEARLFTAAGAPDTIIGA